MMNTTSGSIEIVPNWGNLSIGTLSFESVSLEMLLSGDWNNFSQIMNMSVNNLTDLIIKSQKRSHRDALPLVATITVFYAIIFVAGVLGNLITCIVISRNKFMHTATNYYLFNLAISDLILLLSGMPPDLYNIWYPLSYPFTDPVCILEGILSETSANATVLTITAFTVERYIAICHPFRQHTMSKLSRAVKFILAIWLTAFILAMPQAMQFTVIDERGGRLCSVKDNYIGHVFAVSGFVFFVGPMTAICVLYVLIGVKLKRSKFLHGVKRKGSDLNRGISAQTRVIRMLIAVAVAFFLCWAPFHAQRLMAVYGSTVESTTLLFNKVYTALTYSSGVMYFLSTCINPLLYNIMSYKFRDAFKVTLARHFGLGGKYQTQNHNYSAINRPNGSLRYPTTVNNRHNTFFNDQLQKRESDISLQDSTRAAKSHRVRCVSVSSQSTLLTSLSKNDVFAANPVAGKGDIQMSTIDDPPGEESTSSPLHELSHVAVHRDSIPGTVDNFEPAAVHPTDASDNIIDPATGLLPNYGNIHISSNNGSELAPQKPSQDNNNSSNNSGKKQGNSNSSSKLGGALENLSHKIRTVFHSRTNNLTSSSKSTNKTLPEQRSFTTKNEVNRNNNAGQELGKV